MKLYKSQRREKRSRGRKSRIMWRNGMMNIPCWVELSTCSAQLGVHFSHFHCFCRIEQQHKNYSLDSLCFRLGSWQSLKIIMWRTNTRTLINNEIKISNLSILSMCKIFMRYFYILLWFLSVALTLYISLFNEQHWRREQKNGNSFIIFREKSMKFIDDIKEISASKDEVLTIIISWRVIQMH